MFRTFATIAIALTLTACTMTTLTPQTTPRIGWTGEQVEKALGLSYDVVETASGHAIWHYSIVPQTKWVDGSCQSIYVRRCMAVYLSHNRVTDVRYP